MFHKHTLSFLFLGSSYSEGAGGGGPGIKSGGGGGGGGGGSGSKLSVKKEKSDAETKQVLDYLLRDDVSSYYTPGMGIVCVGWGGGGVGMRGRD